MRYETIPSLATWIQDSSAMGNQGKVAALAAKFSGTATAPVAPPPPRSPALQPIDNTLELLDKAWSLMAKRNLVVDLNRAILAWEAANAARPRYMTALKEVTTRTLQSMPLAQGYTSAILAGWAIGCNYRHATGHMSKNSAKNPDYFRHSANDSVDMAQKCADMVAAIRAADNAISANGLTDNAQTLKVFMAPEFYFRGKNGAYSPGIVSEILPTLRRQLGDGFDHWLFVFGTAVAAVENELTYCHTCGVAANSIRFERLPGNRAQTAPKCSNDPGGTHDIRTGSYGAEVQNVALVSYRHEDYLVAKEYVSGIDYIANEVTIHPNTPDESDVDVLAPAGSNDPNSLINSVFDDERMGGCILNIAGLTIGLEVCLDHIASPQPNRGRAYPQGNTIHLLLIPSYGMTIGTGLYCKPNGIVFNVDGRGHGRSHLKVNDGGATNPAKIKAGPAGVRGTIELWGPLGIP